MSSGRDFKRPPGATLGNPTPLEIPSGGTSRWEFQRDVTSRWEIPAGESPAGNFQRDVELSSDPAGNSQRVEVTLGIPSGT